MLDLPRYQLGGCDVALAARRPKGRVLVVYLDRLGQPSDRYREVDFVALRRLGWHLAQIKAAIAALPEARLAWESGLDAERLAGGTRERLGAPRLYAHHAIPAGDE